MELIVIFTTAFIIGFSGAMMPGPLLTVTISESTRRGIIAGPLIVLGHAVLELGLVLALVEGLTAYLTKTSVAQTIAVFGGGFLLYMGYGMIKDALARRISLPLNNRSRKGEFQQAAKKSISTGVLAAMPKTKVIHFYPVLAGVLVSMANPYWILWWATIGLGYITYSLKYGYLGLTSFFCGHIMADLIWYSIIAIIVTSGRKFLNDRIYQGIILICGIFLIGLGAYFILNGLTTSVI